MIITRRILDTSICEVSTRIEVNKHRLRVLYNNPQKKKINGNLIVTMHRENIRLKKLKHALQKTAKAYIEYNFFGQKVSRESLII